MIAHLLPAAHALPCASLSLLLPLCLRSSRAFVCPALPSTSRAMRELPVQPRLRLPLLLLLLLLCLPCCVVSGVQKEVPE